LIPPFGGSNPPQPASQVSQVNCEKVREMPGVSHHSPPLTPSLCPKTAREWVIPAACLRRAIFGVSLNPNAASPFSSQTIASPSTRYEAYARRSKAGQAMSERRELYRSPNGDSWYLGREPMDGHAFIIHQPNAPSGGRLSHIELGEFLRDQRGRSSRRCFA
jgi:hypothetical protein